MDLYNCIGIMCAVAIQACAANTPSAPADETPPPAHHETTWDLPSGEWEFGPTDSPSPFCGFHLQTPAQPVGLLVPANFQLTGTWCVLASIQMVADYYGLKIQQCQLADWRDDYPEGTCCGDPPDEKCDHGTGDRDAIKLLTGLGFFGAYVPDAISEDALRKEIVNGRPVIMAVSSADNEHFIVATGYHPAEADGTPAKFDLFDPIAGSELVTYDNIRSHYWDGNAVWQETFYRLSPSPDGCNRNFDPACECQGDEQ